MDNKKHILCCIILFLYSLFFQTGNLKAQSSWTPVKTITSGYADKNPKFGTKQNLGPYLYKWEFLVFERHINQSANICVLKLGPSGQIDSTVYITNDAYSNLNPSISYDDGYEWTGYIIKKSLILWEKNRNGRTDIFGCFYNIISGWGAPFPVDTSAGNKFHPHSVYLNNSNFALVYEKNNDIIYRNLNAETNAVTYDTNLTVNESAVCKNPFIMLINLKTYVSYEKKKPNNENQIDIRISQSFRVWTAADTIAYAGNNVNSGFVKSANYAVSVFNSNRLGNYNIYGVINFYNNTRVQENLVTKPGTKNSNFDSFIYPIITDDNGSLVFQAKAHIETKDSVKIKFGSYFTEQDSIAVNDSNYSANLSMNKGMALGNFAKIWVVFNKDSSAFSNLYGKSISVIISKIIKTGNEIAETFSLHQNFPNPFNPETKINFNVPSGNNSPVKLIIYDALGQEVEQILNQQLDGGSYQLTWNAENFAGGVYFLKLISADFSDTKKLILLK